MSDTIEIICNEVIYSGRLIDVVKRTLRVSKTNKISEYSIEVARRPPGVRLLVERAGKYLLLKEFRSELLRWDYRLANGKVFESQADHLEFLNSKCSIDERLVQAVKNEGHEELGLNISSAKLELISHAGATIEWDLYFFRVNEFEKNPMGPPPESTELLQAEWHEPAEVLRLIQCGEFSEDRSIGFLLKEFLLSGYITASSRTV